MIGKLSPQKNFFDEEIFKRIPQDNPLVKIKRVVDFDRIGKQIEPSYDPYQGRPSWPIATMIKALFLEIYFTISDRELERQLRYNFLYRWFVDLSFYDREPDATSMSVFRSRIGEEGAKAIFEQIVRQAKEAGVLVGRIKAVDATHLEANAAKRNVVNALRHARNKILGLFRKEKPKEAERLEKEYIDKDKTYHKSTEEEIKEEVDKTRGFIERLRFFCVDRIEPWLNLLAQTLDKIIRKEGDRIASFVDTDARWGHKAPEKAFLGYKLHTVHDESRIVTSVETMSGNENEATRLIGLLKEDKRKGIEGTGMTADKLYDSVDNRRGARKLRLIPYILSRTKGRKIDRFNYDVKTGILSCEAGKEPIGKIEQERGWLYYFSLKDCTGCSHRDKCMREGEKRQRVYLSEGEQERLLTGKAVTRREAKRIRLYVEPKYGEAKVWHGLGRARWRGRWRVAMQAFITFGVMNAKRLVRLVEKRERGLSSC